MRTTVSLSISCRKNVFLLKFSKKNTFFPHEMDKLTVVLMSIKRLNKESRPLIPPLFESSWWFAYVGNMGLNKMHAGSCKS